MTQKILLSDQLKEFCCLKFDVFLCILCRYRRKDCQKPPKVISDVLIFLREHAPRPPRLVGAKHQQFIYTRLWHGAVASYANALVKIVHSLFRELADEEEKDEEDLAFSATIANILNANLPHNIFRCSSCNNGKFHH